MPDTASHDLTHDRPAAPAGRGRERMALGVLLLAAAYLFAWGIGSYSLWDPWEPKYAEAVQTMRDRGDFVTPYLDGKIRWTKPILIYWAMAASTFVLGDTEFAVRLPSVLAALFGVWVVYYAVRRIRGPTIAFFAAAVLVTLPQYFYLARQATPDMMLTAFVTGAMGFLALARFCDERRELHLMAFWACLALGFLTKGPLALALTLWATVLFLLPDVRLDWLTAPGKTWRLVRHLGARYRIGRGLLIFTAIALPWYGAMLAVHGSAFIENFFLDENVKRFQQPLFGHEGITSRYVTTLAHGTFPWAGLLFVGLLFLFYPGRSSSTGAPDADARIRWYFLSWLVSGFSIFTFAATKLDHYLLPVIPAVAVLIALIWEAWLSEERPWWVAPGVLLSVLITLLPFRDFVFESNRYIMSVFAPAQTIEVMETGIDRAVWGVFIAWVVVMALAWLRPARRWVGCAALAVAFFQGVFFCHVVIPAHSSERNLRGYIDRYAELAAPDSELLYYGWIRYSIQYYGPEYRHFEPDHLEDMLDYVKGRPNVFIVAQDLYFDEMLEELHRATRERWTKVSNTHPLFTLITNGAGRRGTKAERPIP